MPLLRALLILGFVGASYGQAAELKTLAKTYTGDLVALTAKEVEFKAAEGTVKTPLAEVLQIDWSPVKELPAEDCIAVELRDGSIIHCSQFAIKGDELILTPMAAHTAKIPAKVPLASVNWLVRKANDANLRKTWDEMLGKTVQSDRAVLLREGGVFSPIPGTFGEGDADGKKIKFKRTTGADLDVIQANLHGLTLLRTKALEFTPVCLVYDIHGNSLYAAKIVQEGAGFTVTTGTGAVVTYEKAAFSRLDFNINKLTYLSDFDPKKVKVVERSNSGLVLHYKKDNYLYGGPIKLGGEVATKGLSVHAYTELEFVLDKKYKEFRAVVGLNDAASADVDVKLIIECDNGKVREETISRKTGKLDLAIKVKDIRVLRITVQSGNLLDLHDHVDLANARVTQ